MSAPDSLGAYLTWRPQPGVTDADRNCVSNIRPEGLAYEQAARTLIELMSQARRKSCRRRNLLRLSATALTYHSGSRSKRAFLQRLLLLGRQPYGPSPQNPRDLERRFQPGAIGELRLVRNLFYALHAGAVRLDCERRALSRARCQCPWLPRTVRACAGSQQAGLAPNRRRRHLLKLVQAAWHRIRASVV